MPTFVLERKQILPTTIDTAWTFFSDPANLARITPPEMSMKITSPPSDAMYAGQIITLKVRPFFGPSVNWVTEITHVEKPYFFVDEQRFGPYRFWHHQHRLQEVDGGVESHDLVHYLLFHDNFAWLMNRLIVAPRLKRIFDYRSRALKEIFPD